MSQLIYGFPANWKGHTRAIQNTKYTMNIGKVEYTVWKLNWKLILWKQKWEFNDFLENQIYILKAKVTAKYILWKQKWKLNRYCEIKIYILKAVKAKVKWILRKSNIHLEKQT